MPLYKNERQIMPHGRTLLSKGHEGRQSGGKGKVKDMAVLTNGFNKSRSKESRAAVNTAALLSPHL